MSKQAKNPDKKVKRQIEADERLRRDIALNTFQSLVRANKKPKRTAQDIWNGT